MVRTGACVCVLASSGQAWENEKIAEMSAFLSPPSGLKGMEGEAQISFYDALVTIPLKTQGRVIAVMRPEWKGLFIHSEDISDWDAHGLSLTQENFPEDLHGIDLPLCLYASLADQWSMSLDLRPQIHSDMEDLTWKDFYWQVGPLAFWKLNEDLTLIAGAEYLSGYADPLFVPMLGAKWQAEDDFAVDILVPDHFSLVYQPMSSCHMGIKARLMGDRFTLCQDPWDEEAEYLYEELIVGPYLDFRKFHPLVGRIEGGLRTLRYTEIRERGSWHEYFDGGLEDGTYVGVSVFLDIPEDIVEMPGM